MGLLVRHSSLLRPQIVASHHPTVAVAQNNHSVGGLVSPTPCRAFERSPAAQRAFDPRWLNEVRHIHWTYSFCAPPLAMFEIGTPQQWSIFVTPVPVVRIGPSPTRFIRPKPCLVLSS